MPQLKPTRPALLFPVLTAALIALACRSPAPPPAAPATRDPAPAAAVAPPPAAPPDGESHATATAPPGPTPLPTSPEEPAEDPSLVQARAALAARAEAIAEPQRERLARTLVEAERARGFSVLLLVALIDQESRFDPQAKGPRGALGLMQIRPFVGEKVAARIGVAWEGERTLLDPVLNVRIGTGYLGELLERFGSPELALAAYNMGPARLARRLARGDERRPAFVTRVLREYEGLQGEFGSAETEIGG